MVKDSGHRERFKTGALRETRGKTPLDQMSPFAEERLGLWLQKGAAKYSARNWERGLPYSACIGSIMRHVNKFRRGLTDEDHLAAIMCNAMFLLHFDEMMAAGVLPPSLDDRPRYTKPRRPK